jgi:hypothetical protein
VHWWVWVLIWVALVLGAAGVLFVLGRRGYRTAKLFLAELEKASERLAVVSQDLQEFAQHAPEPAVFGDPSRLRQERFLERHRSGRGGHHGERTPAFQRQRVR